MTKNNHMKITKRIGGVVAGHVTLFKLVGNEWEIGYISVEPQYRGKGIGSELLTRAMSYAVKNGLVLIGFINPERDGGLTHDQIKDWLKRHGFKNSWYCFDETKGQIWLRPTRGNKRVWIFNEG